MREDRATMRSMYRDVTRAVSLSEQEWDLLPRGKGDDERVEILEDLPVSQLHPLVRHLMIWLQDINWPVSHRVNDLLLQLEPAALLEPIREVLATNDDIWKTNTIRGLVEPRHAELLEPLRAEITRIAEAPTAGEIAEDTAEAAQEILAGLFFGRPRT